MSRDKLKPNAATQPTEDTDHDGYGSPAYLKWTEENDEWLAQQIDESNQATLAALEIIRTLFEGKHEKQQNKNKPQKNSL